MTHKTITRGTGLLEGFLSKLRARQANKLIPDSSRFGPILRFMTGVNLVSSEEINEHKYLWDHAKMIKILELNNFDRQKIKIGYFELHFNLWMIAQK